MTGSLDVRAVLREMIAAYRKRWPLLLGTGLVVFVPVGLLEALENPLEDVDVNGLDLATALEGGALIAAQSVAAVIGTVLYAGIVSAAVAARREGPLQSLPTLLRTLPYGRLVAADVLLVLVVAVGLVILIIPGFVLLTWFALVAPAIEIEHRGVLSAFRRSRELVRDHFWKVALLVVPTFLAEGVLAEAAESVSVGALGHSFVADWAGSVVGNLLTAPIFALAVVVLFYELRSRSPRAGPR